LNNPASTMSPDVMTFTELLDEYLEQRLRLHDLSDEGTRRFAKVTYELNVRCSPKSSQP
jgi:hypothetical protein